MIKLSLVFFSQVFCGRELGRRDLQTMDRCPSFSLLQILLCGQELGWWLGTKIIVLFLSRKFFVVKGVVSY